MSQLLKIGSVGIPVQNLQRALNGALKLNLIIDGAFGQATHDAVSKYQQKAGLVADGIAGAKTLAKLGLADPVSSNPNLGKFLSEKDIQAAAELLGVSVAAVKAVNEVEARGQGFLDNGKVKILFERHKFKEELLKVLSRSEVAKLEAAKPTLISSKYGGYLGGSAEYVRFSSACQIHEEAAIKATSWGVFQIMGFNHKLAGFESVLDFYKAMQINEGEHLKAFCHFVISQPNLHAALKKSNWKVFASLYNGPDYARNAYDSKLAAAFKRFGGGK